MTLRRQLSNRVIRPAFLGYLRWRGDPIARLLHPSTLADPYPLYADIRQRRLRPSRLGAWTTADHEIVAAILRDRRFGVSPTLQPGYRPPRYPDGDPRADLPPRDLLSMDPPDHTRIRRLVAGTFSPKAIDGLEPWIRELTARLLTGVERSEPFDLVDVVAHPVPIAVICKLLGVPAEDEMKFRVWGYELAGALDLDVMEKEMSPRTAELALNAYLRRVIDERRSAPDDSLLSELIAAEEEGDRLGEQELLATALLVLVAGFETTVNLIGNGVVALLRTPEQWACLRDDPSLIGPAVDELLRYDSPVQLTSRTASEDVEIAGTVLKKGSMVLTLLGGANRDPAVFPNPGSLIVDRENASEHLSFSYGVHRCLGAALARLEGRIVLEELIGTYPDLRLAAPPVRRRQLVLRGFNSVPVATGRPRP